MRTPLDRVEVDDELADQLVAVEQPGLAPLHHLREATDLGGRIQQLVAGARQLHLGAVHLGADPFDLGPVGLHLLVSFAEDARRVWGLGPLGLGERGLGHSNASMIWSSVSSVGRTLPASKSSSISSNSIFSAMIS